MERVVLPDRLSGLKPSGFYFGPVTQQTKREEMYYSLQLGVHPGDRYLLCNGRLISHVVATSDVCHNVELRSPRGSLWSCAPYSEEHLVSSQVFQVCYSIVHISLRYRKKRRTAYSNASILLHLNIQTGID